MSLKHSGRLWCAGLLLCLTSISSVGKDNTIPIRLEKDLDNARALLHAFKNDSANVILTGILEELEAHDELNSHFGLKVQYRQAEALEKDHQDEEAIRMLLELAQLSEKTAQWEVLSNTYLSLARLFEKIGRWDNCHLYLEKARNIIRTQRIDNLYSRFALRNSSYHRLHADRDSAVYYAQEVLKAAPKFNLIEEEAVGHMLLGLLTPLDNWRQAISHFRIGGNTFRDLEDYSGYSYMLSNITKIYFKIGKYEEALAFSDSTLIAAKASLALGHEKNQVISYALQTRGRIYKEMGQQDSAWYYLNKGYEMEINEISASSMEKVVEIDARYKDEKKALLIKEQELLLREVNAKRNRDLFLIFLAIVFSSILSYYYFQLRKANRKTLAQAVVINKANEDLSESLEQQIMLQGEVHHRVKNNLQVIISLLELQKEEIDDVKAIKSLDTMANRIYSMAAIHEILYQNKGTELINLLDYTKNLCTHFANFSQQQSKPVFKLEIDNRFFNLETLMPLGIILNELLTNSLKYAKTLKNNLIIGIQLKPWKDGFCISYRDNGPGFPTGSLNTKQGSLGAYLLKSMSKQLSGHLETINDNGAVCHIYFKEKNRKAA